VGKTNGRIVEPRGNMSLGWWPIFQHEGYEQTYAEMEAEVKNKILHRTISIRKMEEYFLKRNQEKTKAITN